MEDTSQMEQRLIGWVAGFLGVSAGTISTSSRVNLDLGVDGEDGLDFIRAFGKEFGVDVSNFPYARYFGPEASHPFAFMRTILRLVTRQRTSDLQPLYVRDLVVLAQRKEVKWEGRQ